MGSSYVYTTPPQHMLKADYILEIQVEQYFNLQHTRNDGFCCEIADDCEDDCDNRFLFCLQTHNIPIGSEVCPLGNYSTGNISGDSMVFNVGQDLEEGVPNPLVFTGPQWPVSLKHGKLVLSGSVIYGSVNIGRRSCISIYTPL